MVYEGIKESEVANVIGRLHERLLLELTFDSKCTNCGTEGPDNLAATDWPKNNLCECGSERVATNLRKIKLGGPYGRKSEHAARGPSVTEDSTK